MFKRISLLILILVALGGCATTKQNAHNIDPLEDYNRDMMAFNDGVDSLIFKPLAQGYRYVTPDFVENRFSNFFSNLLEVRSMVNALLQGKINKTMHYTGRFLVNSTVGIGGLFEVADEMGIKKIEGEDFGQTLAVWGVRSGPYIVLPLLGPSTLRDGAGLPIDNLADPLGHFEQLSTSDKLKVLSAIDTRARLLGIEKSISGDPYTFIRGAYLGRRQSLIHDGKAKDEFTEEVPEDF